MATFFDIDDPIIRKLNFKQVGDDYPGLHRVAPRWDPMVEHRINPQEDYAPKFQEMIDFVQSDALPGQMYVEYSDPFKMAASNGGRIVRYHSIHFYFTDSDTAFAFKMRFG